MHVFVDKIAGRPVAVYVDFVVVLVVGIILASSIALAVYWANGCLAGENFTWAKTFSYLRSFYSASCAVMVVMMTALICYYLTTHPRPVKQVSFDDSHLDDLALFFNTIAQMLMLFRNQAYTMSTFSRVIDFDSFSSSRTLQSSLGKLCIFSAALCDLFAFLFMSVFAVSGALAVGPTNQDIVLNAESTSAVWICARLIACLCIFGYLCFMQSNFVYSVRSVRPQRKTSRQELLFFIAELALASLFPVVVGYFITSVKMVLALGGAFAGSLIMYLFPTSFYFLTLKQLQSDVVTKVSPINFGHWFYVVGVCFMAINGIYIFFVSGAVSVLQWTEFFSRT